MPWLTFKGILFPPPSQKVSHRPQILLPCSSTPLPTATASESSPIPWSTFPWPGVFCSMPDTWQTCHTWDSTVVCGSPPLGPLACLAHGVAWSESGMNSISRPFPCIPPPNKQCRLLSAGRRSGKSWAHPGGGGGGPSGRPGPPCYGTIYLIPRTPPPDPHCT